MVKRIVYVVKCNGLYWTGGDSRIRGQCYWSPERADAYEYRHVGDAQSIHNGRLGIEIVASMHFEPELDLSI